MVETNDPDAIWKPGYDGPASIAPVAPVEEHPTGTAARTPRSGRRGRRRLGVVGGVALGLIATIVAVDPLGSRTGSPSDDGADAVPSGEPSQWTIEPPNPTVFGSPEARRLPIEAAPLWEVDIEHEGDHWVEVVRRDLVIAAVEAPTPLDTAGEPATTVIGLDALTGEQRWSLPIDGRPRDVSVIGAVDDVLVLERPGATDAIVTGVDIATGEPRWSSDGVPTDGHVGLIDTPFIARLPLLPDRLVSLIDASSGAEVGTIVGDPTSAGRPGGWSTAGGGIWQVIDGGMVVEYDLRVELGEAAVLGRVTDASRPWIVVDDRLAVVDDSGSIAFDAGRGSVTVSSDVPQSVRSMLPVSTSAFVVSAPGTISGVGIERDALDVTWSRRDGVVVRHHPAVGRSLIQLATRGGSAMELIDGLTGATVEHLTMMPGALQAVVVAGDGAVVLKTADVGTRLVGIDFDGTERWSILGSAPVAIGDRIAVRAVSVGDLEGAAGANDGDWEQSTQRLRITTYGDA